jgi:hypothetical protein
MSEHKPIQLLIDGNNLAHFLYQDLLPGQKMSEEISLRLMVQLDSYARQWAEGISVELYLDRLPHGIPESFSSLRVFPAEFPLFADDVLIDRFWFHHLVYQPCLVITNDENILDEVKYAGGNSLRVFDFVRRRGITNPVLLDPYDFPPLHFPPKEAKTKTTFQSLHASVYFRISQDRAHRIAKKLDPAPKAEPKRRLDALINSQPIATAGALLRAQVNDQPFVRETQSTGQCMPPSTTQILNTVTPPNLSSQVSYCIDLDNWPLGDGIRFLKQAFCRDHRHEYKELLGAIDYNAVKPADLRAVAELLLYACADEANLARRGSTMDRVRIALLQAGGAKLTLSEIAQATDLKINGLQRKIKEKAGRWLRILPGVEIELG